MKLSSVINSHNTNIPLFEIKEQEIALLSFCLDLKINVKKRNTTRAEL